MGIFSAAAKALKRGVKAAMGRPLEYGEMAPEQVRDFIQRQNRVITPLEEENKRLRQELKQLKKTNLKTISEAIGGGTVLGVGGTLGTQAYINKKKKEEAMRRRLLNAAIKNGNPAAIEQLKHL